MTVGGGLVNATARSALLLTEHTKEGGGFAITDFDNFFSVTGADRSADVTFEIDYRGELDAEADAGGFFSVFLSALLTIEDTAGTVFGSDLIENFQSVANTSFDKTYAGFDQSYAGALSVTASLDYGTDYLLYAEVGADVFGFTIPIPGTMALMGLGLAGIGYRWQRSKIVA